MLYGARRACRYYVYIIYLLYIEPPSSYDSRDEVYNVYVITEVICIQIQREISTEKLYYTAIYEDDVYVNEMNERCMRQVAIYMYIQMDDDWYTNEIERENV